MHVLTNKIIYIPSITLKIIVRESVDYCIRPISNMKSSHFVPVMLLLLLFASSSGICSAFYFTFIVNTPHLIYWCVDCQ